MDNASTIGEKSSILVGLTMASLNKAEGFIPESNLEIRLGLLVSSRSRLVFRCNING